MQLYLAQGSLIQMIPFLTNFTNRWSTLGSQQNFALPVEYESLVPLDLFCKKKAFAAVMMFPVRYTQPIQFCMPLGCVASKYMTEYICRRYSRMLHKSKYIILVDVQ